MDERKAETPLNSTAILNKIENGELKVKGKNKRKTKEPEKPEEIKPEVVKEKAKAKTEVFPADAKINDYSFLHFKNSWLENLGWTKGMPLKIDKNPDGSITMRRFKLR
jgi:hypothetical protein